VEYRQCGLVAVGEQACQERENLPLGAGEQLARRDHDDGLRRGAG